MSQLAGPKHLSNGPVALPEASLHDMLLSLAGRRHSCAILYLFSSLVLHSPLGLLFMLFRSMVPRKGLSVCGTLCVLNYTHDAALYTSPSFLCVPRLQIIRGSWLLCQNQSGRMTDLRKELGSEEITKDPKPNSVGSWRQPESQSTVMGS